MKPAIKSLLAATGIAAALLASPAFAEKWNMPTRSNERNYFTRNILQFSQEVKKGSDGKVEIVVAPRGLADQAARGQARGPDGAGADR
jgi:TRAP-type C4-dicarboxylate transport system substrate-binding protein